VSAGPHPGPPHEDPAGDGTRGGLTSWRLLAAIVGVVLIVVGLGVWALQNQIRSRTLDSTVKGVMILSSVVVDRSLTLTDITDGVHPVNRAEMDADMVLLKERDHLIGLAIWSLDNGRLVYADVDNPAGGALRRDLVERARTGTPFTTELSDRPGTEGALEIYYPFDANGDRTMDAVAQVLMPRQDVDASIAHATRLLYGAGALILLIAVAGILQVRRRQIAQDYATVHDPLTGLGNRVLLRRVARPMLAASTPTAPTGLLLVDLDGFKAVNDTLGHHAGDALLQAVAGQLRDVCEPAGTPIRLGGDEFAVLLPRLTDVSAARHLAERLRAAIRRPVMISGLEVEIDASIGVAWAPEHAPDPSALLHCADVAMYRAKHAGGGVVEYEPSADLHAERRVTVLPELRQAMAAGELEVFYELRRAADGRVREVGARLRWHHPRRGLLDAEDFVPAVERTSLIEPLTAWVLRTTARECARWRAAGREIPAAVPLSPRVLLAGDLPDLVRAVADEAGVPIAALRLEVSEATLLAEPAPVARALDRLDDLGVAVSLTDVGAAYAPLAELTAAPMRTLTVDGALADHVAESPVVEAVVAHLAGFARSAGMASAAHGVRTTEAARRLVKLGLEQIAGPGVNPPMSAEDLNRWLAEGPVRAEGSLFAENPARAEGTLLTEAPTTERVPNPLPQR
jgi:diguanylate cyclase